MSNFLKPNIERNLSSNRTEQLLDVINFLLQLSVACYLGFKQFIIVKLLINSFKVVSEQNECFHRAIDFFGVSFWVGEFINELPQLCEAFFNNR